MLPVNVKFDRAIALFLSELGRYPDVCPFRIQAGGKPADEVPRKPFREIIAVKPRQTA